MLLPASKRKKPELTDPAALGYQIQECTNLAKIMGKVVEGMARSSELEMMEMEMTLTFMMQMKACCPWGQYRAFKALNSQDGDS